MRNDMQPYELWYWGYDPDNVGQTQIIRREVLVSCKTYERILSKQDYGYYEFIIDDGQKWILAADCIMQLRQKFDR